MTPDYERAATKAAETLIQYNIGTAPVDPLRILKSTPGVLVLSFEELSKLANIDRQQIIDLYGCENQDAVSTVYIGEDKLQYVVTYNKLLPAHIIDRALARELGHILLEHNGTKPEYIRNEEARFFAVHLLCPRPMIHALQAINIRITVEVIESITSLSEHCVNCIHKFPGVSVPAELNRKIAQQFMEYILNYFEFSRYASMRDSTALVDFGDYMYKYKE